MILTWIFAGTLLAYAFAGGDKIFAAAGIIVIYLGFFLPDMLSWQRKMDEKMEEIDNLLRALREEVRGEIEKDMSEIELAKRDLAREQKKLR